jgi:hypothetical protein
MHTDKNKNNGTADKRQFTPIIPALIGVDRRLSAVCLCFGSIRVYLCPSVVPR